MAEIECRQIGLLSSDRNDQPISDLILSCVSCVTFYQSVFRILSLHNGRNAHILNQALGLEICNFNIDNISNFFNDFDHPCVVF